MTPSKFFPTVLLASLGLLLGHALLLSGDAEAQPGATPPGSVSPYGQPAGPPAGPPPAGPPPASSPYGQPPPANAYNQQPYYGPPMPPRAKKPKTRRGWHIGGSAGIGVMTSNQGEFACGGCEVDPPTSAFDLHVGKMLSPRFALQGEVWIQSRDLDVDGMSSIDQNMAMIAAQYWLSPRFWLKAGIGYAGLSVSYYDGFEDQNDALDEGLATMGALGYELMHSQHFALDLQARFGRGNYEDTQEEVTTSAVALGINWY